MPKKCHRNDHPDHTKELGRLNRIAGQVEGLREMIEDRRYCMGFKYIKRHVDVHTKLWISSNLHHKINPRKTNLWFFF